MSADMDSDDFYDDLRQRRKRSSAQRRLTAHEVIQRCRWLDDPLVYWAGSSETGVERHPTSPLEIVERWFAGKPPGVYVVRLRRPPPPDDLGGSHIPLLVESAVPLSGRLLAESAYQLVLAARIGRRLARLVDDPEDWIATRQARLDAATAALRGAEAVASHGSPIQALALEDVCIWLGARARQASSVLPADSLRDALAEWEPARSPGWRIARIAAGRRRLPPGNAGPAEPWYALGGLLRGWPAAALGLLPFGAATASTVCGLVAATPLLGRPEVADTLLAGSLLPGGNRLRALVLLAELAPVMAALDRLDQEPVIRRALVRRLIGEAFACQNIPIIRHNRQLLERGTNQPIYDFDLFSRLYQVADPAIVDAIGVEGLGSLGDLYRGLMGVYLPHRVPRLSRGIYPEEYLRRVQRQYEEVLADGLPPPHDPESRLARSAILDLAAELAMERGLTAFGQPLADWLDACREVCQPGPGGHDGLLVALEGLQHVMRAATGSPMVSLNRLGAWGHRLLAQAARSCLSSPAGTLFSWRSSLYGWCLLLPHLDKLSDDDAWFMLRGPLRRVGSHVAVSRPDHLARYLRWVRRAGPDLGDHLLSVWGNLFVAADTALLDRCLDWADRTACRFEGDWRPWLCLVDDAADFLSGVCRPVSQDELRRRQAFLADSFWIFTRIVDAVHPAGNPLPDDEARDLIEERLSRRRQVLALAWHWHDCGFANLERLVGDLLAECRTAEARALTEPVWLSRAGLFRIDEESMRPLTAMAGGNRQRLLNLLHAPSRDTPYPTTLADGWQLLQTVPGVLPMLAETADITELIPRLLHVIPRLALVGRLQVRPPVPARLRAWAAASADIPDTGDLLDEELSRELARLMGWRQVAGAEPGLPGALGKILDRPSLLRREHDVLAARADLSATQRRRLDNLRLRLDSPTAMQDWIRRDFARELPTQSRLARLDALERIVNLTFDEHWTRLLPGLDSRPDDPDWDNALLFGLTVKPNRRIMGRQLRALVGGQTRWPLDHPLNKAFLKRLAARGFDRLAAWTAPFEISVPTCRGPCLVRAEDNPLRILQMGNYFGTCLSLGGGNSFGAVANTVEVNKRVLYACDAAGRVISRKLLVLTPDGLLTGFRSYGAGDLDDLDQPERARPWLKIALDLAAAELAHRAGLKLATEADEAALVAMPDVEVSQHLAIFARWFFDGFEHFDWWVHGVGGAQPPSMACLLEECGRRLGGRSHSPEWASALRCLLWAGSVAIPVAAQAASVANVPKSTRAEWMRFLAEHAGDPALRRVALDHARALGGATAVVEA